MGQFRWLSGDHNVVDYQVPESEYFITTFCRDCSSPMPKAFEDFDVFMVPGGSLDQDPGIRPEAHIYVGSKAGWDVITDDIPRVPERANFFTRAAFGDFGPRYQTERQRFATKTPSAQAYRNLIGAMVPYQDGPVATTKAAGTDDPAANAQAVKTMAYYLGGDMVGVCACPAFALRMPCVRLAFVMC